MRFLCFVLCSFIIYHISYAHKRTYILIDSSYREKEVEKEKVVEAIVEKELNLDRWCGGCRYGSMNFTCAKRVDWLVSAYGMSQDQAKESTMNKCGRRRLRGIHEFNFEDNNDVEAGGKGIDW